MTPAGILGDFLWVVVSLFPLSEMVMGFVKRGSRSGARVEDRGSMRLLWGVITLAVFLAVALSGTPPTRLRLSGMPREITAGVLLLGGLALRWVAILKLGRFFTPDVAIHSSQRVVTAGPYRYMRHPSYSGVLLAFLGLGVFLGNWLSIAALMVPITLAILHRVRIEEAVLMKALGPDYAAYCARTKRLIPGIL